jgi:hypothetical protein
MSYACWITMDCGGLSPLNLGLNHNVTFNLRPMFVKALGGEGIRDLGELQCKDCIPLLLEGIESMMMEIHEYKELNPPNGWGNHRDALGTLETLLDYCKAAPNATMHVQ